MIEESFKNPGKMIDVPTTIYNIIIRLLYSYISS